MEVRNRKSKKSMRKSRLSVEVLIMTDFFSGLDDIEGFDQHRGDQVHIFTEAIMQQREGAGSGNILKMEPIEFIEIYITQKKKRSYCDSKACDLNNWKQDAAIEMEKAIKGTGSRIRHSGLGTYNLRLLPCPSCQFDIQVRSFREQLGC